MSRIGGRWFVLAGFLAVVLLVIAVLGQVTVAALALERSDTIRLALWRLDSRVFPAIAREDGRPVSHFEPLYPPTPALDRRGQRVGLGAVLVPSPLLSSELPDWMALHFVVDAKLGWRSPQVPDGELTARLQNSPSELALTNVTPRRAELLAELAGQFPAAELLGPADRPVRQAEDTPQQQMALPPQVAGQFLEAEFQKRSAQQSVVRNESKEAGPGNNAMLNITPSDMGYFRDPAWAKSVKCMTATVELMSGQCRRGLDGAARLLLVRAVRSDDVNLLQGVLIDWPRLRAALVDEVADLLPGVSLELDDGRAGDARMTALPVRLETGPVGLWPLKTPIRWGLAAAWAAAALALAVAGLSAWALLDLSERRFRFVTAVTHELRTPLTTLRLYLDMLTSGLVQSETQRGEYLDTLHQETDRLHRLIANVLDFARLERQRPVVRRQVVTVATILETVRTEWDGRCKVAGMELVVESPASQTSLQTDPDLCRQMLGNLIDNACKYAHGSDDPRVWLRAAVDGEQVLFEVEDRGPGVPRCERRRLFRPFRRGSNAATSGGVGLGLALAARWAKLLGGSLDLKAGHHVGACFQFRHPSCVV